MSDDRADAATPPGGRAPACDRCGGELIEGSLVLPVLGPPKFAYSLRGRSVETEVESQMCGRCGVITLRAVDPERIQRADAALRRADAARQPRRLIG